MTPEERLAAIAALKDQIKSGAVHAPEAGKLPAPDRLLILLAEHILGV
jgi:hypothetical protein